MLEASALEALLAARHGDPFAVLGLHEVDGRWWLRALLPGADAVEVIDTASGQSLVALIQRHADGLFEAAIPRRRKRFDYRLRVRWSDGAIVDVADAYAFGPQIEETCLQALQDGREQRPWTLLGAHPNCIDGVDGVRFALWAPNARRVSVVGGFNAWDGRRHAMRLRHAAGVWEIFVPHIGVGELYKFELLDAAGKVLPLKADPYARSAQLRPENASRVVALPVCRSLPPDRATANARQAPISIYEVHPASWKHLGDSQFPDWDALANHLPDYAAGLGFTHIELMPISEYPFDGSWGYQTLGLYAPSARFGDIAGFERFVDACHGRGLGLLIDWVPAHFPSDPFGMVQFDGSALYEYADPREGFHRDWNTLIYNFGRTEVRSFLAGSALYWLQRGIDGLRVDAVASMLYRDYSREAGQWLPNAHGGRENLEAISLLQQINIEAGALAPGTITAAEESTAFPGVCTPTDAGGLGFHYKWNMGWMNDTLRYIQQDPVHRRWHHELVRFGLVYAFSENFILPISHDEVVHGKGSMLAKMPGDDWQRFANLRAYYGFMWGHPGKKLLFMGQEFAQTSEWNHQQPLPWGLLDDPRHSGMQRLIGDLNRLYRDTPALHRLDCEGAGFEWIEANDEAQAVFAWARFDGNGGCVLVVCNFTPVPRLAYRIGVPSAHSHWREALNTDSQFYGGSNLGNGPATMLIEHVASQGRTHSLALDLPPLATLFLVPV